jgi:tetratricopeptide (TPR) repeat protein
MTVTAPDGSVTVSGLEDDGENEIDTRTIASPFELDDVVNVPTAYWRPRDDALSSFRLRPEWASALEHELELAQDRPRPLSVPRRVFISYRWGRPDDDAWVERLHDQLVERGNEVVFDREAQRLPQPPSVPALVAEIASCHVFLAVLDPGYLERVTAVDDAPQAEGWVTDEYQTAIEFARHGLVLLIGLLRAGDTLPSAFRPFRAGRPGNTFDVRRHGSLDGVLDRFFRQADDAPDPEIGRQAAQRLKDSELAAAAGDVDGSIAAADRVCELVPGLPDGFAQRARVAYAHERPEPALADSLRALQLDPDLLDMRIFGSAAAADLMQWPRCAQLARSVLERDREHPNAHFLIGRALDGMDQVEAARAHFVLARRGGLALHDLFLAAGVAALRGDDPHDAVEWFDAGASRFAHSPTLHQNAVLAAIESEQPTEAYERLQLFAERFPDDPNLGPITAELTHWLQTDDPPPRFMERVDQPPRAAVFSCDACGAMISLPSLDAPLCAGCGKVCASFVGECDCCGADGRTGQMIGTVCPFCHGVDGSYRAAV